MADELTSGINLKQLPESGGSSWPSCPEGGSGSSRDHPESMGWDGDRS